MTLTYRFKKERLESGEYVNRPRILVEISGSQGALRDLALLDTGCDITVIPEGIAKAIGLDMKGTEDKLVGFHESTGIVHSSAGITFIGKEHRQSVTLYNVPVAIALKKDGYAEEEDVVLGIEGIFDAFDVTLSKSTNKIFFKRITKQTF